ncbi:Uncharacterised protein [Klebsiella pneumoniae]|uniref:Uncharacterized protein n=1 Tax=Klebsiella pneumoniae TaxID=573 RepID=A0A377TXM1_KLEPN|nr:Uncharacterised protein [Klebsiella pneumoniae]
MDPREVGDIEKAFDLAAGKSLHLEGRAVDLLKSRVVPVRMVGNGGGLSGSQARQVQISP